MGTHSPNKPNLILSLIKKCENDWVLIDVSAASGWRAKRLAILIGRCGKGEVPVAKNNRQEIVFIAVGDLLSNYLRNVVT